MTVGVAAIARVSKAVVAMADRRLTYGDRLAGESTVPKILPVGNGWYALWAGAATMAELVVGRAESLAQKRGSTADIELRSAYQEVREQFLVDAVLRPRLLDKSTYIARSTELQPLDDRFRSEVDAEIREFQMDCQLLMIGFVDGDANLFTLDDSGLHHQYQGFASIGSGSSVALSTLLWSEIDPSDDIDVQLYQVLDAKAHAEMEIHVGPEADAWIFLPDHEPIEVPKEIRDMLDQAYDVETRLPFKHRKEWEARHGWEKPRPIPPHWQERLKEYVDSVAGKVR